MHDIDLSSVARLIGDPTRAVLLTALLDGRAWTAGELGKVASVAPATSSSHLSKLQDAGIVTVVAQGRHRYYRLANADVAQALETLATISAPKPTLTLRASSAATALRPARLCYDHIAGRLGVRIHDHLVAIDGMTVSTNGFRVTDIGSNFFASAGVDVAGARRGRRPLLRSCLDWTERQDHLGGVLAAALAAAMLENQWLVRRVTGERGLTVTPFGAAHIEHLLS